MKYLKVYTDFAEVIEPINDAEAGRLFRAMLKYAGSGEPSQFSGNERYIWPIAKLNIDRGAAACEQRKANGSKHTSKSKQDEANTSETERNGTERSGLFIKDKDKDKDNITPIQSFVHSVIGRDDEDGLERTIKGLHLDLYEGSAGQFAKAVENALRVMWRAESLPICGRRVMREELRDSVRALTIDHIDHLLAKQEGMDPDDTVTNGQGYLISCLYNAPFDVAVNSNRGRR